MKQHEKNTTRDTALGTRVSHLPLAGWLIVRVARNGGAMRPLGRSWRGGEERRDERGEERREESREERREESREAKGTSRNEGER